MNVRSYKNCGRAEHRENTKEGKHESQQTRNAKYDAMLQQFDALVMPTTPMKSQRRDETARYTMVTNTAPFDVTGHPGLSIPCGMSDGLPIGLMMIGRHFDDATLLATWVRL